MLAMHVLKNIIGSKHSKLLEMLELFGGSRDACERIHQLGHISVEIVDVECCEDDGVGLLKALQELLTR